MPHLSTYVALADHSEAILADSFRAIAEGHANIPDIFHMCETLAKMSDSHRDWLAPIIERFGEDEDLDEPERLRGAGVAQNRDGEIGLLRDLQDLHMLATLVRTSWTAIAQGAQGLRDHDLLKVASDAIAETHRQLTWLDTRMRAAAPQALIVAP